MIIQQSAILTSLCLHYVLLLRTLSITGQIIGIAAMSYAMSMPPPITPMILTLGGLTMFSLFSWWRIRSGQAVTEQTFLVQLLVDILALTILLYFLGGSTNPLVSLLLLPVTVAAAILRPAFTWAIASVAAISYTALMFIHAPTGEHQHHNFEIHIWGMWFGFLLSACLVAYFVSRIGATLRANDHALARAREDALKAEQVVALGTLAAGTAHELGTPLATMAVLGKELELEYQDMPELVSPLGLLRNQIDRCKEILSRMSVHAGQLQAGAGHHQTVDEYLQELLTEWQNTRGAVQADIDLQGPRPGARIIADRTLSQAILNVLNNAADVSNETIQIKANWDDVELQLEVIDQGGGISPAVAARLGEPFVTTKPPGKGLGLGLYLARSTLDRLGGSIDLNNRENEGVSARIKVPLAQLTTD